MEVEVQYESLVESLKLLASAYENQRSYLPDYVIVQDEVIALFEDAFLLLPQIIEAELVDRQSIASIIRCYNFMNLAIRNSKTSDLEIFKSHENWQKVRNLAGQALIDMKEPNGEPNLSHINWVD